MSSCYRNLKITLVMMLFWSHSVIPYLCQTEQLIHVLVPLVAAVGARLLALPEPAHDGLQDGGKRCNPDPRCDEHGVLGTKHVARRSTKRAINVYLGNDYFDSFVNRFVASNDLTVKGFLRFVSFCGAFLLATARTLIPSPVSASPFTTCAPEKH